MNKYIIALIIGILVILGLFLNYISVESRKVQLEENKLKLEQEQIKQNKEKEEERNAKFFSCLKRAEDEYSADWELNCSNRDLEQGCSLPMYLGNKLQDLLTESKKLCKDLYL